ncbi:hypothetical protein ACN47E_003225 [Coniothyrium glycines]
MSAFHRACLSITATGQCSSLAVLPHALGPYHAGVCEQGLAIDSNDSDIVASHIYSTEIDALQDRDRYANSIRNRSLRRQATNKRTLPTSHFSKEYEPLSCNLQACNTQSAPKPRLHLHT